MAFTGSTATALKIRTSLAENAAPGTPLIAETGGLNAMIVDSTALPEQAVAAVIESAFQSAGQRCSALRCLYVQADIAPAFTEMLKGAMDALQIGQPWHLSTDVGPVIDEAARRGIEDHIATARKEGRILHALPCPADGTFVAPTLIAVNGIAALEREVFGPVLHLATFEASEIDQIVQDINATGYGLTFGLHTRIDDRVQHIADRIAAGNVYVNRNQIGAIVGSQPFGGTGLSGTGPKAGGPDYLLRFSAPKAAPQAGTWQDEDVAQMPQPQSAASVQISETSLPGPTGESNRLSLWAAAPVLCAGPGAETAQAQAKTVEALGGRAICASGQLDPDALEHGPAYGGVLWWGDADTARAMTLALSRRDGPILPLITAMPDAGHALVERHLCIDTTAAGGNAALLGEVAGD